jgi:hypothetical protein
VKKVGLVTALEDANTKQNLAVQNIQKTKILAATTKVVGKHICQLPVRRQFSARVLLPGKIAHI